MKGKIFGAIKMVAIFVGIAFVFMFITVNLNGLEQYFKQKSYSYNALVDSEACSMIYLKSQFVSLNVIKRQLTTQLEEASYDSGSGHNWFTRKGMKAGVEDALDFCAGEG